ncbi:unnamed protein product [Symbiodinium natans]|uniref:Acyltransferase 3 domain-containing protein n=1 Tax=Symbiodinium natans TaxID=878477 RepID=A0A812KNN7_9DINO|nr:unnamed protein product [Symbiodinium natans]
MLTLVGSLLVVNAPTLEISTGLASPMRFLGDISMCAYMIHLLLAEALGYAVGRELGSMPWWTLLAVLPVTILLGWLLTEFFEKPIERCCRPDKRAAKKSNAVNEAPTSAQVIGSPEAKVG